MCLMHAIINSSLSFLVFLYVVGFYINEQSTVSAMMCMTSPSPINRVFLGIRSEM